MDGNRNHSKTLSGDVPRELLERYFGFREFRPGQREVVDAVLRGGPVVAVMPTGAGKSLCYQLPALMSDKTVLVVSPLISLMKDQVDTLVARNIAATYINSQLTPQERQFRMTEAITGKYRLIYVAPERFRYDSFLDGLKSVPLGGMAIDEAHCISQWGHDFRPDYLKLPDVVAKLAIHQVCAFTATATPEVLHDISRALHLVNPQVFVYGFRRDNLILRVIPIVRMRDKIDHVVEITQQNPGSGIVYAATRKHVEEITSELRARGVSCGYYHAGMDELDRNSAQDSFMGGEVRVMIATNAFGMGIDKSDVRFVVHYDLPGSVEAYYQEAGRAGRDGKPAECAILFSYADVRIHEFFISRFGMENPDSDPRQVEYRKRLEKAKLRRMVTYCYAETCRHAEILGYFGDKEFVRVPCSACDNCEAAMGVSAPRWARARVKGDPASAAARRERRPKLKDPSLGRPSSENDLQNDPMVTVRKILSAVARSRGRLDAADLIALMRGNSSQLPDDLEKSRSFGILTEVRSNALQELLGELAQRGVLYSASPGAPRWELTPLGISIMRGEQRIALNNVARVGRPAVAPNVVKTADEPKLGDEDLRLLELLKKTRLEVAQAVGVPAFVVAHNSVLVRLAQTKPVSADEMLMVKGLGPVSVERYGHRFLETIQGFLHCRRRG